MQEGNVISLSQAMEQGADSKHCVAVCVSGW